MPLDPTAPKPATPPPLPPEAQAVLDKWNALSGAQPPRLTDRITQTTHAIAEGSSTAVVGIKDLTLPKHVLEILARGREMTGPRPVTIPERLERFADEIFASRKRDLPTVVRRLVAELKADYPITTVAPSLSKLRTKIKAENPAHPALKLLLSVPKGGVALSAVDIQTLRRRVRLNTVMHQAQRRPINDPLTMVRTACTALKSDEWSHVAAALLLLTGRRLAEIVQSAHFSLCSPPQPHRLRFKGQLKTRGAQGTRKTWYSIDVLGKPIHIVRAFKRLRRLLPTDGLLPDQLRPHMANVRVACHSLFGDYTPKDLRAVQAKIAYHAYAPPSMDPLVYFSKQLGHKLLAQESPHDQAAADADTLTAAFYLQFYIPDIPHRLDLDPSA